MPEFYVIFAWKKINKMPKLYMIFARKNIFPNFGGQLSPCRPSPTPMDPTLTKDMVEVADSRVSGSPAGHRVQH